MKVIHKTRTAFDLLDAADLVFSLLTEEGVTESDFFSHTVVPTAISSWDNCSEHERKKYIKLDQDKKLSEFTTMRGAILINCDGERITVSTPSNWSDRSCLKFLRLLDQHIWDCSIDWERSGDGYSKAFWLETPVQEEIAPGVFAHARSARGPARRNRR